MKINENDLHVEGDPSVQTRLMKIQDKGEQ